MNTAFGISGILLFLTCFILIITLIKSRKIKAFQAWLYFNLSVAIWGIGSFLISRATNAEVALNAWKIAHVGSIFIAPTFFHFVNTFCKLKYSKLLLIVYSQAIIFVFLSILNPQNIYLSKVFLFNSIYYLKAEGFIYTFSVFIWLSLVFWGHYELVKFYRTSTLIQKNQVLYLFLGLIIGFSGGITNFLPMFGVNVYPFGNFTIPLYCVIVTYAILRYRLMDINIVFKKTAVYSLSAGLLVGLFILLVLATTKYLTNLAGITSFAITAVSALLISLLFSPLRNRIQTVIDKKFYKKTYDYYSTIQKVSHELASSFSLGSIYSFIGGIIFSALGLKNIYFLCLVSGGKYVTMMAYSTSHEKDGVQRDKEAVNIEKDPEVRTNSIEKKMQESEMAIDANSEIVRLLKTYDVVIREELPQIHKINQEVIEKVNTDLKPFEGEAVVPVFINNNLELLMILSEKISGDIFSSEDIKLLRTVSDQMAVAIKNAKLYMDKLTSDRLAAIGMMSATFAHEIKNPLTSIKTFAQLLPERYSDIDFRENFSKIVVDSANRIDSLIKDLMDFSSERTPAEMSTLNIGKFMDRIIDETMTNLKLNNKKITIEKDYENINVNVLGDENKLSQAFSNIITNGCQSIPVDRNDGTLRVGIIQNKENVDISIADNGDGMSTEDVIRSFEPFFSTKTIGAGLGLAITKKIIEDHYGKIVVDSTFKKGTTFKITLPIKKMEMKSGNLSST
jgi:signal transduction histidine kinase